MLAIDFDSAHRITGWSDGIAWRLLGYATEWTEESWTFDGGPDDDPDDDANYFYNEPKKSRTARACAHT